MCIVIDAHLIREFYREVKQGQSSATAPITPIIESLSQDRPAYLDDNGMIKHKWRTHTGNEWFWGWYPRALQEDKIQFVAACPRSSVRIRLQRDCGFPVQSRKMWYLRTSEAVADELGDCVLLTEDLHFYDPTEVGCGNSRKERILANRAGCVVGVLVDIDVAVHCAASCPRVP